MTRHSSDQISFQKLLSLTPKEPLWRIDWAAIWALWAELPMLDHCPQDPEHHGEGDVGTHTRMVVQALVDDPDWRSLEDLEKANLFWAAVLHDIGKPGVTRHEEGGRITSRGHSRLGASIARSLLRDAGVPFAWREQLCGLISAHQLPFWLIERDNPTRLAIQTSWRCQPNHLCLHARADAQGRICTDPQTIQENVILAETTFEEAGCLTSPYTFANAESRVAYFEREDRDPAYPAHEDFRCEVTVMAGLPGSGKDTWLSKHRPDLPVVSLDAIRVQTGHPPTGNQGRVVQAAQENARDYLRAGKDFAWNGTNVTRQVRAKVLRLLRDYGARIQIVYLEPSPDCLRQQNASRPAAVPNGVIEGLVRKLEPPELWEAHGVEYIVPEKMAVSGHS